MHIFTYNGLLSIFHLNKSVQTRPVLQSDAPLFKVTVLVKRSACRTQHNSVARRGQLVRLRHCLGQTFAADNRRATRHFTRRSLNLTGRFANQQQHLNMISQ